MNSESGALKWVVLGVLVLLVLVGIWAMRRSMVQQEHARAQAEMSMQQAEHYRQIAEEERRRAESDRARRRELQHQ